MSSPAQILANQANSQKSCGPKTRPGKEASSDNRRVHGLSSATYSRFFILETEAEEEFYALKSGLFREHSPKTETEKLLVRRMVEHEWLRARAVRLGEDCCLLKNGEIVNHKAFALCLRYQTTHERAFYKALNELQKLRNERRKEQIGFESQKRAEAAEQRAAEALNLKKQEFELKKQRATRQNHTRKSEKETSEWMPTPETSPGNLEMAA
jgi:hypothetical protein